MPQTLQQQNRLKEFKRRIAFLTDKNTASRSLKIEEQIVDYRHKAALCLSQKPADNPTPDTRFTKDLFEGLTTLPEIDASDLTAAHMASGLLFHGALLVRGLFSKPQIDHLMNAINFAKNNDIPLGRGALCSPFSLFELTELYRNSGLLSVMQDYHGGNAVMMYERARLRIKKPGSSGALPWHQDANFFCNQYFAVNCWAAITQCGKDNPGLQVIPRRMTERVGWDSDEAASLTYGNDISRRVIDDLSVNHPVAAPIFEPGDALLFDEMTMHATNPSKWSMPNQIVAISWFFNVARMPSHRTPLIF